MIKLLMGGSPCTHWSIAQTMDRETAPSGIGWELFLNYRIARDEYQPDYFLYENNKSMSVAIRAQITMELGVEPVLINSASVSAQSRQRLYWVGRRNHDGTYSRLDVPQPEEKRISFCDVLEGSIPLNPAGDKARSLTANYHKKCCSPNGLLLDAFPARPEKQVFDFVVVPAGSADRQSRAYYVYEVKNGQITIGDKRYSTQLSDGRYIVRKLTVAECKRLQTVPEDYIFPVSDTQAYKMLGNGWTVDVIAHILSCIPRITTESVEVLSVYDGMCCGHIALDKLGADVMRYYAIENDKYAIQTTVTNYPETIQLGDAFQVRENGWVLCNTN